MDDFDFLPEGYEPPKAGGRYTRFEDGKTTRIRILSQPILGWEYWNKQDPKNAKPVRLPYTQEDYAIAKEEAALNSKADDKKVNHFWAMVVWNYETKQIEICEITQKTIHSAIRNLISDKEYGHPSLYDIKISKKKDGDKTTYEIMPGVPKEVSKEITEEFEKSIVNLNALFEGKDPFELF